MTQQRIIIPVDHGNRNLKTENYVFTSGVMESDCRPMLVNTYIIMISIMQYQTSVFPI